MQSVLKGGIFDNSRKDAVLVDIWENQRYKPMAGGWKSPYLAVPSYSTIDGLDCNVTSLDDVVLVPGWTWNGSWVWDKSDSYGEMDEEGWAYARNFEELFKLSVARRSSGRKNPVSSLVRRRRLIRQRVFISGSAAAATFTNHIKIHGIQSEKLQEILSHNEADVETLMKYEGRRRQSCVELVEGLLDRRYRAMLHYLSSYRVKFQQLRVFLEEKGRMEDAYAKELGRLGRTWAHGGSVGDAAAPGQVDRRRSFTGGGGSSTSSSSSGSGGGGSIRRSSVQQQGDIYGGIEDDFPDATVSSEYGFFHCLSIAHTEVSEHGPCLPACVPAGKANPRWLMIPREIVPPMGRKGQAPQPPQQQPHLQNVHFRT